VTKDTTTSDGTAGSGAIDDADGSGVPNRIAEQFENIKRTRRRRALGWTGLLAFLAFATLQAFAATELLNPDARLETTFVHRVADRLFPITNYFGVIPFLDFGQYIQFIRQENLLYDPEIGRLLFQFPEPDPTDIYVFFFQELGIFQIFGGRVSPSRWGSSGRSSGSRSRSSSGRSAPSASPRSPSTSSSAGRCPSSGRSRDHLTLIFIPFLGLGPASAAIAIAFDTIGNLGRLFVDELEEIEDGPIEAMRTTGASKPQIVFFGMLSQVRTAFIAWTLYIFEINVRIGVTVGVIGAGDSATSSRPRTCCGSPR